MKKIAVIGSGISGLTSAYLLSRTHEVHLFESQDQLGGHTATKTITHNGETHQIDTGFIVFNEWTYDNFLKLLDKIGISRQDTQMSFSVLNQKTGFEYNGHTFFSLFSQKKNIFSFKFYRFLAQIIRFNRISKQVISEGYAESTTLDDFLQQHQFSEFFAEHYILPMVAAIWSGSIQEARQFPLKFFLKFFMNHGLLNVINRPQWYVIANGSHAYIKPLIKPIQAIHLTTPVTSVKRLEKSVEVSTKEKTWKFDEVIFACHSDQALSLLADPSAQEKSILGNIPYRKNSVILHTDISRLPRHRASWASWNFFMSDNPDDSPCVTYNMNILQSIKSDSTFCVSLNQKQLIDPQKILGDYEYSHPVIDATTLEAQSKREQISGHNRTHYCGAYWHQGFHEDGVVSALQVCEHFGVTL